MVRMRRAMTHDRVGAASAQPTLFVLLLRHFQPFLAPQTMHALLVHLESFLTQQNSDHAVTIARVAQRQLPHPLTQNPLSGALLRFVPLGRSRLIKTPARRTLRGLYLLPHASDHLAPLCRRQYFPFNCSLSMLLSSSSSATIFFNLTFSFSRMNIRRASSTSIPPYFLCQRQSVPGFTPSCLATSRSDAPDEICICTSCSIRTICSGL